MTNVDLSKRQVKVALMITEMVNQEYVDQWYVQKRKWWWRWWSEKMNAYREEMKYEEIELSKRRKDVMRMESKRGNNDR